MNRIVIEKTLVGRHYPLYVGPVRHLMNDLVGPDGSLSQSQTKTVWLRSKLHLEQVASHHSGGSAVYQQIIRHSRKDPAFFDLLMQHLNEASAFQRSIKILDDTALLSLRDQEFAAANASETDLWTAEARDTDMWAFFSHPQADADFNTWSAMPYWTSEETIALSFGKAPSVVNHETMQAFGDETPSLFATEWFRRVVVIARAIELGELSDPMRPRDFIEWADERKLSLPDALREYDLGSRIDVAEYQKAIHRIAELEAQLRRASVSVDDLDPKLRRSMYKIIVAMAVERYGHKTAGNSPAIKQIVGAVDDLNIGSSLIDDTVRKILSTACDELDVTRDISVRTTNKRST